MSLFAPSIIEKTIRVPSGEKRGAKLIASLATSGRCAPEATSISRTCGLPPAKLT